ncbi:ParB/RepB/Spo0J family partition protein [Halosquirtibacter xylanolyticus]|uniref:ParB/RepB/Spo0J family partition protein n=1 Tax=Halosquirtibacter xylanolyticus TaxID=3374599 RepID=UPI003748F48B|nr:ParB/RepB/Spo0J family partition protein [Prolixibacteraceae bacterium]
MAKRNALGRGLGALINDADLVNDPSSSITHVDIDKIEANPFQPRTEFDDDTLIELATSIQELGLIQPITLRKIGGGKLQIIAGERRFRASQVAGLTSVPCWIRQVGDEQMLEMALVENIQRENLSAIEVALSYQRLIDECNLTQDALSDKVGKKRATVSNYLRLLKLPVVIQNGLQKRALSMGHARAIINIDDEDFQVELYHQIIEEGLSVRKVEELVRQYNQGEQESELPKNPAAKRDPFPQEFGSLQQHLRSYFDATVDFRMNDKGKGKIVIPFDDPKELERIISILDQTKTK